MRFRNKWFGFYAYRNRLAIFWRKGAVEGAQRKGLHLRFGRWEDWERGRVMFGFEIYILLLHFHLSKFWGTERGEE